MTFNGQDMTVEEFITLVMAKTGGMGGGLDDEASMYDPEEGMGEGDHADGQAPDTAE